MAQHKLGTMKREQNEASWRYFVNFWKIFFGVVILGLILLALLTL